MCGGQPMPAVAKASPLQAAVSRVALLVLEVANLQELQVELCDFFIVVLDGLLVVLDLSFDLQLQTLYFLILVQILLQ